PVISRYHVVTGTEITAGTLQMRRRPADYRATMASRWSIDGHAVRRDRRGRRLQNTSPVAVTVTGADAHSGIKQVTYRIDSGAETTVSAASVVANVTGDGNHTLYTKVMDRAGNETGFKASPINIDTTAPANQTPLPSAGWRGADYAVIVSGADGGSG